MACPDPVDRCPESACEDRDTEDDTDTLINALSTLTENDLVLAISASGTTPYTLEAVRIASDNPDREVVFFAIGFETTASEGGLI